MNESTQNRLKQIMSERNLKQRDILEMSLPYQKKYGIKMGKSALSQYVNGKSSPDQHKLFLLGATLGVDEAWLMGFDVPKKQQKEYQPIAEPVLVSRVANLIHQLEPSRQAKVYSFAEKQLKEQNTTKNDIVDIQCKKKEREQMTLAAHDPNPDREYSEEEINKIHDYLDELDAEYDRKHNKDN